MASGINQYQSYPKGPHEPWDKTIGKAVLPPVPTFNSLFSDQFFLGFHDQLARWQTLNTKASFPPYNLVKVDKDTFVIELAVAGYSKEDVEITVEKDLLIIKGTKEDDAETNFVHHGIAGRNWQQSFVLGEFIVIKEAVLKDGMLKVTLEREVPEELKPKTIKIK